MTVPVTYHQESEKHATEVGGMCHTVATRTKCRNEFDGYIAQYKPLGLDGEGEGDDEQSLVGECHTKGKYDCINGSRCTYRSPCVQLGTQILYGLKANGPLKSKIHGNAYAKLSSGSVRFLIKEQEAKSALMATKVGQKMSRKYNVFFTKIIINMINLM